MIIDFHTHVFPDKIAAKTIQKLEQQAQVHAFTDGREQSLTASMEAAGIDLSIVLPVVTRPEQFDTINQFAERMNRRYENKTTRLLSFGGIHPASGDYKEKLRHIRDLGLKGIKLHPDYQGMYFDDIRYMRILDYASELGLICVTHAGTDIGYPDHVRCTPLRILHVINEVSPRNLVLAHYGSFGMWQGVEEALAGKSVYLDTSYTLGFIDDALFLRILQKHGENNVLFATDSPWGGQQESLEHLRGLGLSRETLQKICGGNAQKLLQGAVS